MPNKSQADLVMGLPGPARAEPDYLDELERLGKLRDQGILTDAEFEAKKKDLLGL